MTALELSEADWAALFEDYATLTRWYIHHDRPALNQRGRWATHITGTPGFPDYVLARSGRVLFCELKSERGILSTDQMAWRDRLLAAGQEWYCWRPRHWPDVQATLAPAVGSSWRVVENVGTGGKT